MIGNFAKFAEKYVNAGFHIMPVPIWKPGEAKRPYGWSKGVYSCTDDLTQIQAWIAEYPDANIACRPGVGGRIVIDFDTHGTKEGESSGIDTLETLRAEIPAITKAWIVSTPSGGFHYWFTAPEGLDLPSKTRVMPGVDIRYMDTYVILPCSTHPDSPGLYQWTQKEGDQPPILPQEILDRIKASEKQKPVTVKHDTDLSEHDDILDGSAHGGAGRKKTLLTLGAKLRNSGLDEQSLITLLTDLDERKCKPPLGKNEVERLVKYNMNIDPITRLYDITSQVWGKPTNPNAGKKSLKITWYDKIVSKPKEWLMPGYIPTSALTLWGGIQGSGKCLGRGTKVLLFDGSKKAAEDIKSGDILMGPDGACRTVVSTTVGEGRLFKVTDTNTGESYIVNQNHLLSVYLRGQYRLATPETVMTSGSYQEMTAGHRTKAIPYTHKRLPIDPYFLGMWLGDGTTSNGSITNPDPEISEYLQKYALESKWNYRQVPNSRSQCPTHFLTGGLPQDKLIHLLKEIQVIGNKHIPLDYLTSSLEQRRLLLAGLLDSDGYYYTGCFEIIQKSDLLSEGIVDLCRSLGLRISRGVKRVLYKGNYLKYNRMTISGELTQIPVKVERKRPAARRQRKNPLHYMLKVEEIDRGEYFGFEVDKDHMFVLGDFTVTHNSYCLTGIVSLLSRGLPLPGTTFTDPVRSLLFTTEDDQETEITWRLEKCGADRSKVGTIYLGEDTFSTSDTGPLEEVLKQHPDVRLIVLDPATAFIGDVDDCNEMQVRRALQPLNSLAQKYKISVILVKHMNKDEAKTILNRFSGATAWTAIPRVVILSGQDNEKDQEQFHRYCGMKTVKANGISPIPLAYEINQGVFKFIGEDPTIEESRLFPQAPERRKP